MWNINKLPKQKHCSAFFFLSINNSAGSAMVHPLLASQGVPVQWALCIFTRAVGSA